MAVFVANGEPILLPRGTRRIHDGGNWGLYYNAGDGSSWVIWRLPTGYQIMPIVTAPGLRYDVKKLGAFVKAKAATSCCEGG